MVVQAAANGFGMCPASCHMGGALPHELPARIGQLHRRSNLNLLDLGLGRTTQNDKNDNRDCADAKKHDGLYRQLSLFSSAAPQRTATTVAWGAEVAIGEPS